MDDAKTNERAEDGMEEEVEGSVENACTGLGAKIFGWENKFEIGIYAEYLRK